MKGPLKWPQKRYRVYDVEQNFLLGYKRGEFKVYEVLVFPYQKAIAGSDGTHWEKKHSMFIIENIIGDMLFVKKTAYQELISRRIIGVVNE